MIATALVAAAAAAAPPPALEERVPLGPRTLAARIVETDRALRREIDAWRRYGDPARERTPRALGRWSLYHQRIVGELARRPALERRVRRSLPRRLARDIGEAAVAGRQLGKLAGPPQRRRFKTGRALPPERLRSLYRAAQRRFGVGWHVLAAINLVETRFNRIRSHSSAGAQGPMQFMPATWRAYGMGGDVHDPRDAIMGAANYLRASGAPRRYRRALYAYNHSRHYVGAVLRYARHMARDDRAFYAYHGWQVFVRTPSGTRRLTSP